LAPQRLKSSVSTNQVTRTPLGTPKFSWNYLVISLLFIALGGCFAVAWNEDKAWKCISIGASLLMIVSGLAFSTERGRAR